MTDTPEHGRSSPRAWDVAKWGALGPAAFALFWTLTGLWPQAADAWDGLPGAAVTRARIVAQQDRPA